jgi:DNA-dependent RNA polymerase auxiliary subunit epsilon
MEPNRYEKMFTMRETTRTVEAEVAGEVRQLTGETGEYNLTL